MSSTEPTRRATRTRRTRKGGAGSAPAGEGTPGNAAVPVSAAQRQSMIAESAYLRAERRGFTGGDPVADWLESERDVDALLSRSAS